MGLLAMKRLPTELRRKAEGLLHVYGGLEGLSKNPPWVIGIVLKTWFTEAERRLILEILFHDVRREARPPMLRDGDQVAKAPLTLGCIASPRH